MYYIIGGDGKQYGPIPGDDVRKWIAEKRLNHQSRVKAEGEADFRALSTFPEFADLLQSSTAPAPFPTAPGSAPAPELHEGDYELDMAGCISRGWALYKANFAILFLSLLVYVGVIIGIAILQQIPILGILVSLANLVITGPLIAGVYYVYIQVTRGNPTTVGDVFIGFRQSFLHLFLGYLVPALINLACLLPVIVVAVIMLLPQIMATIHHPDSHPDISTGTILVIVGAFVVCLIPVIYFSISWLFTLPLVIDRQMDFWSAMGTSRRMVGKHWWQIFGLTILVGLINLGGFLACCVGALFTAPIGFAALICAYESIFSKQQTH